MTANTSAILAGHVERARQVVATTGSLDEAVGVLVLELMQRPSHTDAATIAALALIQLAADEDCAGVTR